MYIYIYIHTNMYVYIYIYIYETRPRGDGRAPVASPPVVPMLYILAIFYPFSQFCEIDISLPSL